MWKPETTSLGSRSSDVGQNIREWWGSEKYSVSNGNVIKLQWPINHHQVSQKKNNGLRRQGAI